MGAFLCSHSNIEDGRKYATFQHLMLYYFKKGKNESKTQTGFVRCMEKELWLIKHVKSGLRSFLVLLTFWPNNSLLWDCLMHWKMFSSTRGSNYKKPIAGDSWHTQNIQIHKVIGEIGSCRHYCHPRSSSAQPWSTPSCSLISLSTASPSAMCPSSCLQSSKDSRKLLCSEYWGERIWF